ncbi:hypothetical protein G6F43_008465 [Rhizopus delemar]|nr:hypothetical protein G6F43_008465 [Rhizopus delemar]
MAMTSVLEEEEDYSVERWEDVTESLPQLSSRDQGYIFVDSLNRKYKRPPVHFSVNVTSIDGDYNKTTCHPGSTFTGHIQLNIEYPLAAQCLKFIFRATGIKKNPAFFKIKSISFLENGNKSLFTVKTILWGLSSISGTRWPMIEPGNHQFQFLCELPQVNYPPTFKHHLASCQFELVASLERPGTRPFQTVPVLLHYQPLVLTTPHKIPRVYHEQISFFNHTIIMSLPKGCSYNLLDTHHIDLQLLSNGPISTIEASLRRDIQVDHQQKETEVISYSSSLHTKTTSDGKHIQLVRIPIKNGTMTTSFISQHTRIIYRLVVTAKVRHGLFFHKRTLFSVVLQMGTLPFGLQVPSSVISYSDTLMKPRFLYVPRMDQEQLPAYEDQSTSPPHYS